MSTSSIDQLIAPEFTADVSSLSLEEVRRRRGLCQDEEEALSLRRRLIQGRLDIVQADLYHRAGGPSQGSASLVESLPEILVEHGDRHLGPGRLTSVDTSRTSLGADFDAFTAELDKVADGTRLTKLAEEDEMTVRQLADQLEHMERTVSSQRYDLHRNIDLFQEEIIRRYKSGEASVEGLLGS